MIPYYEHAGVTLYCGDCLEILPELSRVDAVVADPPYGDTSLDWDVPVAGWLGKLPSDVLWCFGSMRFWMENGSSFTGWRQAQDLVWEKHNGSSFHADRFKRVHELIVQWYRGQWADLYKSPPVTMDATQRTVRRKQRPPHMGDIDTGHYTSEDGGPRLMRSVIPVRSCHGHAVHPTQKPLGILRPLIEFSVPPGGVVLDPFSGSGSTLLAAMEMGRRAIGIEISEAYCKETVKRLAQKVLPFGAVHSEHP